MGVRVRACAGEKHAPFSRARERFSGRVRENLGRSAHALSDVQLVLWMQRMLDVGVIAEEEIAIVFRGAVRWGDVFARHGVR